MKALITTISILAMCHFAQAQYTGGTGSGYASAQSKITWLNAERQYRAPSISRFITLKGTHAALPSGITIKATEITLVLYGSGSGTVQWGDGSFTSFEYPKEGSIEITHTYQAGGNYNVKVSPYRRMTTLNIYWL